MKVLIRILALAALGAAIAAVWFTQHWVQFGLTAFLLLMASIAVAGSMNVVKK